MIHILKIFFTILPLSLSSCSLAAVAVVMTANSARIAATLDCAAVPALGTVATFASKVNALEFVTKVVMEGVRTRIQKKVAVVHTIVCRPKVDNITAVNKRTTRVPGQSQQKRVCEYRIVVRNTCTDVLRNI